MKTFIAFLLVLLCSLLELIHCKSLKDNPRCNFTKSCSKKKTHDPEPSDLDIFECVLRDKPTNFTEDCKNFVFEYARDYFKNNLLRRALITSCSEDIKGLECKSGQRFIFCVLDQKDKVSDYYCQHIIQRVEYLISTNFALVSDFRKLCENDIKRSCSQAKEDSALTISRENMVLDCLQKQIDNIIDNACQKEILNLSEIQGENIKLDNNLRASCSVDRAQFCSDLNIDASSDLVYKCLQEFINNPSLSPECQGELLKRERLVLKDYKVGKGLVRACREDIRKNRCRRMISDDRNVRLAQMLLCLENAYHNGSKIAPTCRSQMTSHRKLLLEDYRLSPEVVAKCSEDIDQFCNNLEIGGKTIHCLFENSRTRRRNQKTVSAPCQRSLENLLKITDVGEDWRVDSVLRHACERVVKTLCSDVLAEEPKVMSCLMDNINSDSMEKDCENALLQIQYFVSRDFKLDSQLFEACHDDGVKFCHAKVLWNDDSGNMDPERGPLVLPCLYRYVYGNDKSKPKMKLKTKCEEQVKRVMKQRAIKVELIPGIEESCIDDLAFYCSEKTGPGEEMLCLQDQYNNLKPNCKSVVGNFTEAEAGDINLNPVVRNYCRPVIKSLCKDESQNMKDTSNDIMNCLIKHKNDADVRIHYKCRAAVEHFQIISLKDYHFTIAFKVACKPYVNHYCPKARNKAEVVECLSGLTQNDTLKDERYKLSKDCRYQLRAQLLQQREFIDLDPKLKSNCGEYIKTLCKKYNKSEVLECLVDNINLLSTKCHASIFRIKQQDFKDSSSDYTLWTTCKTMIRQYCSDMETSQALTCLKNFKDEPLFDSNCKLLVLKRMVEQSEDYRLNPALQRGCSQDIGKFCSNFLKNHLPDVEFEGKILHCLKVKFRESKLRKDCETQLSVVLKEAALNYKLNPLLRNLCTVEIQNICAEDVEKEKLDNTGQVEECLKGAFMDGLITNRACKLEVAGLIEEAKADINADPLLHRACALDITKYCINVPQGAGRILKCLQIVLSTSKQSLQPDCKLKLTQRIEMFKNVEVSLNAEPRNFAELMNHVNRSPSRKYFVVCLFSLIGVIFVTGLFCGRATRRIATMKNK